MQTQERRTEVFESGREDRQAKKEGIEHNSIANSLLVWGGQRSFYALLNDWSPSSKFPFDTLRLERHNLINLSFICCSPGHGITSVTP
jgi:hypothetical protein